MTDREEKGYRRCQKRPHQLNGKVEKGQREDDLEIFNLSIKKIIILKKLLPTILIDLIWAGNTQTL